MCEDYFEYAEGHHKPSLIMEKYVNSMIIEHIENARKNGYVLFTSFVFISANAIVDNQKARFWIIAFPFCIIPFTPAARLRNS